jgi:hypothetical protein
VRALGPVVLLDSLTADQLGEPRAYHNARYLLTAAAAAPIPATATLGNLTGSFVERALAEMRWPAAAAEVVRFVNKTLDEPDVPLLRSLREALQNGRMLRRYRGAFHTTTRGRALLAPSHEGELYLALFEAYFAPSGPALAEGHPAGSRVQLSVPQLLWLLLQTAGDGVTVGDLAAGVAADPVVSPDKRDDRDPEELSGALRQTILDPIEELGLIERMPAANECPWRDEPLCKVHVTPLFERFVIAAASLN